MVEKSHDELHPGKVEEVNAQSAGDPIVWLRDVLGRLFGRTPHPRIVELWRQKLGGGLSARAFVRQIALSKQFTEHKSIFTNHPHGHFFSPVVDPSTIREYYDNELRCDLRDIAGIDFHLQDMVSFWMKNRHFIASTPFKEESDGVNRYHYQAGPYDFGDAITLRAMIGHHRPRRVIEIGSGFSSACMLDSVEHAGIDDFKLTCIEPYPQRLKSLLRASDFQRVKILESGVQGMPLDMFRELEAGDFLFIDSTHVLKTGSDVHYEIFHILPVLNPGVLIHIHDCRYPFEYSEKQVFQKNYSWNEVYAIRALLMWSTRFKIVFYNSLFADQYSDLVEQTCPAYLRNPGSALWLQVQD